MGTAVFTRRERVPCALALGSKAMALTTLAGYSLQVPQVRRAGPHDCASFPEPSRAHAPKRVPQLDAHPTSVVHGAMTAVDQKSHSVA